MGAGDKRASQQVLRDIPFRFNGHAIARDDQQINVTASRVEAAHRQRAVQVDTLRLLLNIC